jgi:hypothetical protein
MMLSLFLGIVLINVGFAAGSWFRGQIEERRLNHVLRYDEESGMWQEIRQGMMLDSNDTVVLGFAVYPPTKEE